MTFLVAHMLRPDYLLVPWPGQGGAETDRSSQPAACWSLARASSGRSLRRNTRAAAACSLARAGRLDLSWCHLSGVMVSRWARAWASSMVVAELIWGLSGVVAVWLSMVPGTIVGLTADGYGLLVYYYIKVMESSEEPSGSSDFNQEFEQALADATASLSALRERYSQVRQGQGRQGALKRRLEELQQEVREVKQQLEALVNVLHAGDEGDLGPARREARREAPAGP